MAINFGGLATGMDTQSIISSLMAIERIPLQRLEAKQSALSSAQSALSSLLSKMSAVKTAAEALSDPSGFGCHVATSSSSDVVATVTGAPVAGSFDVSVNQLALEQRTQTNAFTSSSSGLGKNGTLKITVGSDAQVDVILAPTDSLTDIAANINQSGARVTASVVFDGTDYYMLVRGTDTGADNAITYSGTTLGLDMGANTYQQAQDAEIVLDGQITITRSSNQFNGVIAGVSLVAVAETTSPAKVTVGTNPEATVEKVNTLVEAYNEAVAAAHGATGYGVLEASHEELAGDSSLRRALSLMSATISTPVPGLTGRYRMLADVGVHLTREGTIELDQDKLEQAVAADPAAVTKVFTGDPDTSTDGVMASLMATVDRLTDGDDSLFQMRIDALGDQVTRIDDDLLVKERRLDDYETNLIEKFTAMELMVSQIQAQESALAGFVNFSFDNNES